MGLKEVPEQEKEGAMQEGMGEEKLPKHL